MTLIFDIFNTNERINISLVFYTILFLFLSTLIFNIRTTKNIKFRNNAINSYLEIKVSKEEKELDEIESELKEKKKILLLEIKKAKILVTLTFLFISGYYASSMAWLEAEKESTGKSLGVYKFLTYSKTKEKEEKDLEVKKEENKNEKQILKEHKLKTTTTEIGKVKTTVTEEVFLSNQENDDNKEKKDTCNKN